MQQEIIVITGTSSGIGFGLAKYYLENGHSVIGMARRENKELSAYDSYKHFTIDITNQSSVNKVFNELKSNSIAIKLLILNAGVLGEIKDLNKIDIKAAKDVMEINLWANKLIIDEIIEQRIDCKQIVAISSGAARN